MYGTGGSFRALGSAYIKNYNYPLSLLHGLKFNIEKGIILLDQMSDEKKEVLVSEHKPKSNVIKFIENDKDLIIELYDFITLQKNASSAFQAVLFFFFLGFSIFLSLRWYCK